MDSGKTYLEVLNWASSFLESHGKEAAAAEYLLMERNGWTKTELVLNLSQPMPTAAEQQLSADVLQLLVDVPPQYIIGSCEFYGARFKVTSDTLIPRPETEELVEWILQENGDAPLRVADIGTGTGIIAVTLKKHRPSWEVFAVDLSPAALSVARENAETHGVDVTFLQGDTLSVLKDVCLDVIVSNPPYISSDEWEVMDASVRTYEPKMALFAEDNGLAVYRKIAAQSRDVLSDSGRIYLEIGYRQGDAVGSLFQKTYPEKQVVIKQDMAGQARMVRIF
ncbi:peptide chain release factor N(5)-glutamine methyltransferase [Vagococcus acidifermentans]|uniref:Release factor glutamine methyltransferase n=1 Tax=Vagococcus acidifermentans TaxID=564710 RepID=A0A430AS88_9ENTE|nr:peptide chain release factor N(5)-glutamine methyltransferase [Vagococcus acidifermentans]RSU10922.1 protein-(glutamine-N5) methyltransferase, release factor-specific [Vagococcus acidifermentans]